MKNTFSVLSVFAVSIAISLGAFAIVAHAQVEDGTDLGYYGASDNLGYYGASDGSNLGYYGTSDNLGYYGTSDNLGYYGTSNDVTGTDVTGTDVTYENGVAYSYDSYDTSYSQDYASNYQQPYFNSFSQPFVQQPIFTAPNQSPIVVSQPQQQQQIRTVSSPSQPINIVNNNTNTNTNVVTGSSAPSIATVIPIRDTLVQYPVQYVYPQSYSYPVYNYPTYYTPTYFTPTYYRPAPVYYPPMTPVVPAPSVSLSQIPYTGFDFGPIGNALYWLSLLAFAAAGAYLLVYYSGNAMSFAKGRMNNRVAKTPIVKAPAAVITATARQIEKVVEPALSGVQNLATAHIGTRDSMVLARSKNGAAPRIVITRA